VPIELSARFREAYLELAPSIQRKVDKALGLLDTNPRHPGLQTKPVQGAPGIYEARVDRRYRLTYERRGDTFILRNVGPHDAALKRP
jgi:mRNA-degrading endonuclease RelE of RelBE toxin-antitoxin system